MSILLVVFPFTKVAGTVSVLIESITVGFVILPVSLIDVTIRVPELSLTVGTIVLPLALVLAAIGPDLSTPAALSAGAISISVIDGS